MSEQRVARFRVGLWRAGLGGDCGAALPTAIIITGVVTITLLALFTAIAQDASLRRYEEARAQAFYMAESGRERAQTWLEAQDTPPLSEATLYPFGEDPNTLSAGTYSVEIFLDDSGTRPVYTIRSTGVSDGRTRTVESDVIPTAFSDYLYFTNREVGGGHPWFYTGETVDGPVHFDCPIAIWGDPVFTDVVETSASTILYGNDGIPIDLSALENPPHDEPTFDEGVHFNASDMEWISQAARTTLVDAADLRLNGGHEIIFGRDPGTGPMIGYVSYRKNKNWTDVLISDFNGIIYVNGAVEVSGVVDGQVTVVSNGQLDIVDDLVVYDGGANGPNPDCDDMIGLVAGTALNVSDNTPNQSDCVIHAYLVGINNNACLVESHSQGSPRGTLTLYGGMAQDKWGPVGTGYVGANGHFNVSTGYERDFHYDWRLRDELPPGLELILLDGGGYARLAWREL